MLTKVFRPGTHNKRFEIMVCDFKVSTYSPSRCPVAASDASELAHGLDKLRYMLGIYTVFHRDQDGTGFTIRIDDRR